MFHSETFFLRQTFAPLGSWWPHLVAIGAVLMSLTASTHVILHKKDSRSAVIWMGLIWLSPYLGAIFYLLLGINHIRRQARILRAERRERPAGAMLAAPTGKPAAVSEALHSLCRLGDGLTGLALMGGNAITPLQDGETYDAMLKAIAESRRSIGLSTYIFDNDRTGRRFIAALAQAQSRGVQVRVLIDDVGRRYSWPSVLRDLRTARVPVACFLPLRPPGRLLHFNLRNHRKILVVDGTLGFTGGINIRDGHDLSLHPKHPIRDTHFFLEGPVVSQLFATFADDWEFTTGESLKGDAWSSACQDRGKIPGRVIPAGPEHEYEPLRLLLHAAIASARKSLRIVTPYFLPDPGLLTALDVAARRGVQIALVLPEENNLAYVAWASASLYRELLESGCRIWLTAPPFDHTKLFLVDGLWALFGSPNWDNRSLRLNFELAVEAYDAGICARLDELVERRLGDARELTLDEVRGTKLRIRLRNGTARLFSPYL